MTVKKYKIIIIIESILIALLVGVVIVLHIILCWTRNETFIMKSESPDKNHFVKVYEVGEPFLLGSDEIRIYTAGTCFNFTVSNDGVKVSKDDIKVEWNDNIATITVHGSEQNDTTFTVTTDSKEN